MKNNFITKIIGATLAFAMMIGVGTGLNLNKQAKEASADDVACSLGGGSDVTVKEEENSTGDAVKSAKKIGKGASGTITVPASAGNTTLYYHAVAWNKEAQSLSLSCENANISSASQSINANSNVSGNGSTFVIGSFSNYLYSVNLTQTTAADMILTLTAASNKRFVMFDAYYTTGGQQQPTKTNTATTITVPDSKTTLDIAASPTDTVQLTAAVTYDTGTITNPTITWTSSNTNVVTVNAGLVTAVGKGQATITASYAGDETYNPSSSQVQITVINSAEVVFNFGNIASANSWGNGVAYTSVTVDGVTLTANGGGNNGKYYTSDKTWRMYTNGSITITPPSSKSISTVTSSPSRTFVLASGGTSASLSISSNTSFASITVELAAAKVLDSISASITNTSRIWRTNDIVQASDLTVIPHYTDGTDGTAITDGTNVTVTNGTLQNVGDNTVNVAFGGKSTTVTVGALSSTIVEWGLSGQIGETVKSTAYNLSGLTLRGWYDNEKTDEASAAVISGYELVANPATAGATADENNTIEVKVYATSDTGRTNCLKTFTDVPAPIIFAARGSEENPYTVEQARAAIDAGTGVNGVYVAGIVSQIVEPYSSEYHNISYNISSDGLTTSAQLEAFRGKSFDGENFTSEDDVEVGAAVVVYGNLVKFNSTYELAQNNRLVSYSISANSKVSHLDSHATLSYKYDKTGDGVLDALTLATTGVSGTSYTDWSGKTGASGAIYAGQSAAGNSSIQLRTKNSDSGIITTNSGGKVTKVTVAWNSNTDEGRAINVYGKNTAYTSATELYSENSDTSGALLGTIEKGESTELAITGDYEFIGIRSANNALYLDEIKIQWGEPVRFAFSNVAIRFGGSITPELWNELDTNEHNIAGFGVAYKKAGTFEGLLKNNIANIETADGQGFYKPVTDKAEGHPDLVNGKYLWNFYLRIPTVINEAYDEQYFDDNITAVAYIKLNNGEVVFLKETTASVKSLAQSLLDDDAYDYDNSSFDGSLKYLADYTGE